jgi:hypothetical protein
MTFSFFIIIIKFGHITIEKGIEGIFNWYYPIIAELRGRNTNLQLFYTRECNLKLVMIDSDAGNGQSYGKSFW